MRIQIKVPVKYDKLREQYIGYKLNILLENEFGRRNFAPKFITIKQN